MSKHQVERAEAGRFLPGQAPRSPGRPRGPSAAEQVRALIEPHRAEIIAKAVDLAKLGDPQALKLCLERLAPTPRPEAEKVTVPGLAEAITLKAKAEAIMAAVGRGEVSAEAGDKLLRMLDIYSKAVALTEMEQRLAAIEGRASRQIPTLLGDDTEDLI